VHRERLERRERLVVGEFGGTMRLGVGGDFSAEILMRFATDFLMWGGFLVLPFVVVFAVGWCGGVWGEADVGFHLGGGEGGFEFGEVGRDGGEVFEEEVDGLSGGHVEWKIDFFDGATEFADEGGVGFDGLIC